MTTELTEAAIAVLRANDRGGRIAPTSADPAPALPGWDSCLAALGVAGFDEDRAWAEIETLLAGQRPDGMVPHPAAAGDAAPALTQPPVAASVARHLFERFGVPRSRPRVRILAPRLLSWHRWFQAERDPDGTGLAEIRDPREGGMEDGPAWDHAPARIADIGFNAILQRANRDLRFLLDMIDDRAGMAEVDRMIARTRAGLDSCWDRADGLHYSRDIDAGQPIRLPGIGCILPLYADPGLAARRPAMLARLEGWLRDAAVAVPGVEPGRPEFTPGRPGRGPVWLPFNWMLHDGLRRAGQGDLAARIRRDSLGVVARSSFREYFDPITGEGIGGTDASCTAAMVLLFAGIAD
jgi:hypothetical protein